jgi:hypothetical protein
VLRLDPESNRVEATIPAEALSMGVGPGGPWITGCVDCDNDYTPASTPISGAEAEELLALRYPKLREAEHAVIACPRRRIQPGGETRCWILARVGQQRSVVVRLSPRGNAVEIDD